MHLWGIVALVGLAILSFLTDWNLVSKSGSIDYRNRVTGARLLLSGIDPYHYKWQPGDPAAWCDLYDNPKLPISKTTVTPAMLLLAAPAALLPYPYSQRVWLVVEWAMLAGLWFLWWRNGRKSPGSAGHPRPGRRTRAEDVADYLAATDAACSSTGSRWWWAGLVSAFTFTLAWRHHIDRGQVYIVFVALFGLWLQLSLSKSSTKPWIPGFLAGILVCLRPPLLLFTAPFILLRRRSQWLGAVIGLAIGLIAPMVFKPKVWIDYAKAMSEWSEVYRSGEQPRPGAREFPPAIEGMTLDHLASYQVPQYTDSSLFRLLRDAGWPQVPDKPVLATLVLLFAAWVWCNRKTADAAFLLGLAAWAFLSDAFLPAYRNPYNDVTILNVVALIPILGSRLRLHRALVVASLALGILMVNILPPARWWIYLPTLATATLAVLAVLQTARPKVELN